MGWNYDYPQWAKAEKMEMSEPLCELWLYSDRIVRNECRTRTMRRKIAEILYRLADKIYAEERGIRKRMEHV